ncbi:probable transcription factor PosF21 isoform X2 [Salvia miltiorrhiza]|uniref:probable transcription factor PosF21 isoform X2 n=1 Tax=Salvia miltiorrhiza TaxID=226208 RepID=UPI0025AD05F9|nr:probable transcription factor PosF21 isoform X2 [Salvia miltiorrhiza]
MNMNSRSWLPPLGRSSVSSYNTKPEQSASSNLRPIGPECSFKKEHKMSSHSSQFSFEISRMPENPPNNLAHRRTHSDVLALLNDVSFDGDLGIVGGSDGLSVFDDTEEDLLPEYFVLDKSNLISETMEELSTSAADAGSSCIHQRKLQHSQSMVLKICIKTEMAKPGSENPSSAESDKSISAANLAELALTDPKRAKRIWANRQSAARSKERKMRYIAELQSKVQSLQTDKASSSMQFALMQEDTNCLASENIELKLQLQSFEQQVHLQDAVNDALKEEIQHLKVLTGQAMLNGPAPPPYGTNQNYNTNSHAQPLQYQFRQHQLDQFQPRQLLLH